MPQSECPILHVFVVGFHHKKGCQVEYCYPPLFGGESSECSDSDLPDAWCSLPSLALPDGAHNVQKDTVFFMLPSLESSNRSVFGVSCYRQMDTNELLSKAADVTRASVQKSVCVLSRLPLFGLLKTKLELITQAYFNERDFAKVTVLSDMYNNLRNTVNGSIIDTHIFIGVSVRDLIRKFRHRVLILFKLLLLEKRVLFSMFPVYDLCHTLIALLSLFPRMIEHGLTEAAMYVPGVTAKQQQQLHAPLVEEEQQLNDENTLLSDIEKALGEPLQQPTKPIGESKPVANVAQSQSRTSIESLASPITDGIARVTTLTTKLNSLLTGGGESSAWWLGGLSGSRSAEGDVESAEDAVNGAANTPPKPFDPTKSYSTLETDSWGFPLSLFTKGSLFLPYVSLNYLDLLQSDSVRGCLFGATNALFKQRRKHLDAIITLNDTEELMIDVIDPELRRSVMLTTADLRFADFLVKSVAPDTGDVFLDNTSWEGGDEWLRLQFRSYLLSLFATVHRNRNVSTTSSSSTAMAMEVSDFGDAFVDMWCDTHNFRVWHTGHYAELHNAVPGHPFAGQLSVGDVRLRLESSLQTSEQGRKLAGAVSQTGRLMANTGRSVRSSLIGFFAPSAPLHEANDIASESALVDEPTNDHATT